MAGRGTFSNPLHQAIWSLDLKRIKRLLKVKNIDMNKMDQLVGGYGPRDKINPLFLTMMSVYPNDKKPALQILKLLLSHPDTDVNVAFSRAPSGNGIFGKSTQRFNNEVSPHVIHFLINDGDLDLVKALVKHPKIDVDEVSAGVITAITVDNLCKPSNKKLQNDIIKALLDHPKIDVNKVEYGVTKVGGFELSALYFAIDREQSKSVEALLAHPNILVNECATVGNLADGKPRKFTPLSWSIWRKQKTTDITRLLLDHPNTDLNKTDKDLALPLTLVPICNERNLSCFEMLLNHDRIDVNAKDKKLGATPLMLMHTSRDFGIDDPSFPNARRYNDKAFKLLLNHPKIDLAIKDDKGRNILHRLVETGDRYDVVSDLLENHPELITPNNDGQTPLDLAKGVPDKFGLSDVIEKYMAKTIKPFNYSRLFETKPSDKEPLRKDKDTKSASTSEKCKTTKDKKRSASISGRCCWSCDATDVKLYKCGGCKKAYYCNRDCADQDWAVHGSYCIKKQKKDKVSS